MSRLTLEQNAILRAVMNAEPSLAEPIRVGDAQLIALWFNGIYSPTFTVWKTSVDPNDIMKNGMDWTRVDNLTVGKARIWDWMTRLGTFNPSKLNVRAGIDAAWVGTAADLAVRAAVYVHCKRPASIFEKLLALGTGTDASPAVMTPEGPMTFDEADFLR